MNQNKLQTARSYAGMIAPSQLSMLLSTKQPIFFDLPHLGAIRVAGDKAQEFLQGQITCDIRKITSQSMRQGALCNVKGRILTLLDIIQYQDIYWLILPKDLIPSTMHSLEKVALLSRVALSNVPEAELAAIWEPPSAHFHNNTPYTVDSMPNYSKYTTRLGHSMFFRIQQKRSLETLIQQFYPEIIKLDEIYWHYLQLSHGFVSIYPETRGLFLPHALNLPSLGFIDFQKGCYKGQEIIARMHYRATNLKHNIQINRFTLRPPPVLGQALANPDNTLEILGEIIDYCPINLDNTQQYLIAYC